MKISTCALVTSYSYIDSNRLTLLWVQSVRPPSPTHRSASFNFDGVSLTLAEAIGKAGGLLDTQANASGVFIFRFESRDVLEKLEVDLKKFGPYENRIPTVYRANFHDPSMLFVANQFPIRHKDIVYVANADSIELLKFLDVVQSVTSSVAGIREDAFDIGRGVPRNTAE